jgi:hypothetical protein
VSPSMPNLIDFASTLRSTEARSAAVQAASDCLDRFAACFNACDTSGMDGELHFPHLMLSGATRLRWPEAGQHPADFFAQLTVTGWHHTRYESKEHFLARHDKVHFVVTYSRVGAAGNVLSTHTNL